MRRFFALLLCAALLLTAFPVSALAAKAEPVALWEQITAIETGAAARRGADTVESRTALYSGLVDQIVEIVENSESYVPGTLERHGSFFFWVDTNGDPNGYSPSLRAKLSLGAVPGADPADFAATEVVDYRGRGGSPASVNIAAFQPYIGIDSSFTAQYENRCNAIAQATGGVGTTYKTYDANINNLGLALSTCGVVIFDSHGTTDYDNGSWSNPDYTTRANDSYLCLTTGAGITAEDKQSAQGEFGTYYHAFNSGGTWCVDGTAMANHMTTDAPNSMVWMAICLGMATDGMEAPFRSHGVEVVYGYSQSVTFSGDYKFDGYFWPYMCQDHTVAESCAYMKTMSNCDWDPAYSNYTYSQAVSNHVAFPIVASSEDDYPGHGNVDVIQVPESTWTLFTQFEVNIVPNNPDWGTVSLRGNKITANPAFGYYVDDYEIVEGEAVVTRDGNVFTVDPQSDCTIQINFAPRDPAVVHFSVPAGVSCADLNVYMGDEIVLPAPEGNPAVESRSFRFLGWATAPMAEDSQDLPEHLNVGDKIKVTGTETTYYALYSYFVPMDGLEDDQFVRVDEAPNSWANQYVLSVDGLKALSASADNLGANMNNRLGIKKAVVDLAELGCIYEDNILNNVKDEVTYVIEAAEGGTFTIRMKNSNHYLAMAADSDTLTVYTSSNSDKTRWNLSYGANGPVIANAQYPNRTLQFDGTIFAGFSTAKQPLTLFAKARGSDWYTTNPREKIVCDEHVFGDWTVETEPTCTGTGLEKRVCTVCGYAETRELPALDHDYEAGEPVAATCTERGYTPYTCTRCGDTCNDDYVDALGHAWDEGVVTTEPTETEPGVKTYTCTRCGETRTEEIPAVEHDCKITHFTDVMEAYPHGTPEHEAIEWAFTHDPQITSGMNETTFGVGQTLTRAQAATFLYAAAGKPEFDVNSVQNPFKDVKMDKWYTQPVLWAYSQGLVNGMKADSYGVNSTLTRGQIMVILYAWADKPSVEGLENPYSDVPADKWFTDAAIWAYHEGIEMGTDGKFAQSTPCVREAMVLYLYRYLEHKCLTNE